MWWLASCTALAGELVLDLPGHAASPVWAADGSSMAFTLRHGGGEELYVVQAAGGAPQGEPVRVEVPGSSQATGRQARVGHPVWHPSGQWVFPGQVGVGIERIYTWAPGGAAPQELLSTGELRGALGAPAVSADGARLALVRSDVGEGDLFMWEVSTGAVVQLVRSQWAETGPSWSSDGERLAFTRETRDGMDIFVWKGGSVSPRVERPGDQLRPGWADGRLVYFTRAPGGATWDLAAVADTGVDRTVVRDVALPDHGGPAITADGAWVVTTRGEGEDAGKLLCTRVDGSRSVIVDTGLATVRDPALFSKAGATHVAVAGLASSGADWFGVHTFELTEHLRDD